ncbi:MAG: hypothetical protein MUF81_20190, partial [Verrucomicrobia bacterium]|nr:hypothetical protein [Verrucomicrobiota bacterium]
MQRSRLKSLAATVAASCCVFTAALPAQDAPLSLTGQWRFRLDRADAGIAERWFEKKLADGITLPGSLAAQGIGDDVTTNTAWIGG